MNKLALREIPEEEIPTTNRLAAKISECKSTLVPELIKAHELRGKHFEKVQWLDYVAMFSHIADVNPRIKDSDILKETKHLQKISPFK